MSLPTFNFLYIKAGSGKTGTSGEQLEQDWKYNFDLIKNLISSLDADVIKKITSNEIQQIKVVDGIAYFTTDDGQTWSSLGASFATIAGNPDDCPALVEKFKDYTTIVDFKALGDRVTLAENNIVVLQSTTGLLNTDVGILKQEIETPVTGALARLIILETDMKEKISSKSIIEIRERAEGLLEYTNDGTNWFPVSSLVGVQWGEILGDINNQADLKLQFEHITELIEEASTTANTAANSLDEHLKDYNNPHAVTAEQIGLGNVDNTADANKPVSGPQQEAINAAVAGAATILHVVALKRADYEAIETKDANTNYRIIDINQ